MGVRKAFQGTTLGAALAYRVIGDTRQAVLDLGMKELELSWILEDNIGIQSIIEDCGGREYKRYRISASNCETDTMTFEHQPFSAIILAADRELHNPVAAAAGVSCKSMAPVNGTPMLIRVIEALASSGHVHDQTLCGPPRSILDREPALKEYVSSGRVGWQENQATPSLSAFHAMASLPAAIPLLLTTSDHALLSPQIVDHFCREAGRAGVDVAAAVVRRETVTAAIQRPAGHLTASGMGSTARATSLPS